MREKLLSSTATKALTARRAGARSINQYLPENAVYIRRITNADIAKEPNLSGYQYVLCEHSGLRMLDFDNDARVLAHFAERSNFIPYLVH